MCFASDEDFYKRGLVAPLKRGGGGGGGWNVSSPKKGLVDGHSDTRYSTVP